MKGWRSVCVVFAAAACSNTPAHRSSAFDCGIPILDEAPVGGRVGIDPQIASVFSQQLPGKLNVADGCWEQMPNGQLEGSFATPDTESGHNVVIYVFEYRDKKWILVNTRYELQMRHRHK